MVIEISEENWANPNSMLSWYFIASYAYYIIGRPIMSDQEFDKIVRIVKENWDTIEHPHKKLVKYSHLEAGTGYDLKFPTIVRHNAHLVLRSQDENKRIAKKNS